MLIIFLQPAANKKIKFEGMRVFYETTENVTDAAYEIIVPGASITTTFDIAKTHDLSQGGGFDVQASGDFIIAHEDNQGPDGRMSYLHFESNLLQADVNGPAAAAMRMATLQKRYHIDGKVSKPHLKAIRASLHNCALMAERAENKARAGPSALLEFLFGANDQETRSLIARYFEIVRKECASLCDGTSNLFDEDHWDACTTEDGKVTVAYALGHEITFCPRFWELPVRAIGCTVNSYDQVTTTIHVMTHLPEIYTKDHTYGLFQKINGKFPTGMALDNARTYELFARGVSYNCQRIGWM